MSHLLCSQDTRTHVVGELYDTERSYVESLQILVEKYMKPLKSLESNRILIDSVLVDEIFYSIPDILQHHENFLGALQDRLSSDWDSSQVIGNVFIEAFTNQQIIDDYTAFINNWKNARQAIKVATQSKPAFERFLEAMSREHRNKLTLDALLIMPVQRIPRYELLIKELIKHTPADHPDHKPLMEAQKKIHELALKIDRAEKEMIHQEQLRDLEALIEGHVELQHHQRDFIRYDLVTIVSASALAATKKERVLFLFCDLLIMTSIKKKASRRSNLQNAFANSSNDLSLLEGNKFKLLLRVPLDQIEIRLDYDQIQLHQQHQEEQHQYNLQRQNKLIQERRREIEADLQTLQQMESLAATLSHVHRAKLDDVIIEMLTDIKQILTGIEHNDMQMLNDEQHSTLSQYSAQDLYLTPSPASISSASTQYQLQTSNPQNNNNLQIAQTNQQPQGQSISPVLSNHHHHHHQQDSITSLEFLINNNIGGSSSNNGTASKESNDFLTIDHQGHSIVGSIGQTLSAVADNIQLLNSQSSNCDSLVVTFSSIERRQAFIQAFIEAKQHRYQQKQQQQQHQGKIFSSSVTLKLALPAAGGQEKRSSAPDPKLHHQGSADAYLASARLRQRPSSLSASTTSRISSSTPAQDQIHQPCGPVILHQMSAPQSLALTTSPIEPSGSESGTKEWSQSSQCTSCSYNLVAEAEKAQLRHHHHHHHHQLMHQPASHPASLDTICCHDPHNNWDHEQRKQLGISDETATTSGGDQESQLARQCLDYNQNMSRQIGLNSVVNLNYYSNDVSNKSTLPNSGPNGGGGGGEDQQQPNQATSSGQQLIDQMNFNLLLAKCAPKFLVTLPVDFLSTQHPALQFTCSALGKNHSSSSDYSLKFEEFKETTTSGFDNRKSLTSKRTVSQTVEDNLGQLWLCMSNGYVSHVALVTIKKRELRRPTNDGQPEQSCGQGSWLKNCYSITPIVISAGDICKSHINCAAQVKWSKSLRHQSGFQQSTGSDKVHDEKLILSTEPVKDETKRPREEEKAATAALEEFEARQDGRASDLNSKSPPIDIKCKNQTRTLTQLTREDPTVRLSESAPSQSPLVCSQTADVDVKRNLSSASTTRLEVPLHTNHGRSCLLSKSMHQQHSHSHSHSHHNRTFNMQSRPGSERRRSIHDEICHRHHHHSSGAKHSNNRALQQIPRLSKYHHHNHNHNHHLHQQHHLHHFNHHPHSHHHAQQTNHNKSHAQQQRMPIQHSLNNYRHGVGHSHGGHTHSHQHHHQHHNHQHHHQQNQQQQQHSNQLYHAYGSRHNTVPIAELRRSLDRQDTAERRHRLGVGQFLSPQASAHGLDAVSNKGDSSLQKCEKVDSLDSGDQRHRSVSPKTTRPTTPTSLASASMKGFRSARLMRHQASLKTSSILAKLVSGATRRSVCLRKSNTARDKSTDLDDNDTDTDTGLQQQQANASANDGSADNLEPNKTSAANLSQTSSQQLDPTMMMTALNNSSAVISPLSSVSSLNSTTSSFTVNSVCASSPNRSSHELLAHSYSTTCCIGGGGGGVSPSTPPQFDGYMAARGQVHGHRGRSATAPSRPLCGQMVSLSPTDCGLTHHRSFAIVDSTVSINSTTRAKMNSITSTTAAAAAVERAYKVSEILNDNSSIGQWPDSDQEQHCKSEDATTIKRSSSGASRLSASKRSGMNSSLWLGCDDGSLIIIDCLMANDDLRPWLDDSTSASCTSHNNSHDPAPREQKTFTCGNVHSEIKLSSPICDISSYKDEKVFVALSNGQLAVFSRESSEAAATSANDVSSNNREIDDWSLTNPEIITVTENELNSTARLCQIDENFLWYSYGRNIFVLNIATLMVETTIMAPTNNLSLRLTVQSITIDNMELMENLSGVWVSFTNSHLIQFYDTKSHKLLVEINLFDPINKLLSYGNEIIRQHKTACLKATSLLNYYNEKEQCNTLFIGTSAGIILYLTISADQLVSREPVLDWKPQIASLRHGHSGHVKLLRLIEMDTDRMKSVEVAGEKHRKSADEDDYNELREDNNILYLISGGTGLDIYGPSGEQQNYISQLNSDEDSLNHLMIWQL